jgi:hypothetical protein
LIHLSERNHREKVTVKKILTPIVLFAAMMPAALASPSPWDQPTQPLEHPVTMTVYRSPTCSCCGRWVSHLKKHGFTINVVESDSVDSVKQALGVPKSLQTCHTGVVEGYLVEGHVPAGEIKKMLLTKPKGAGLVVPGMPDGSPGMEKGKTRGCFTVYLFDKQGYGTPFSEYSGK